MMCELLGGVMTGGYTIEPSHFRDSKTIVRSRLTSSRRQHCVCQHCSTHEKPCTHENALHTREATATAAEA